MIEVITKLNNESIHFTVILGLGYKYREDLISLVDGLMLNITLLQDVKFISEHMSKADLAISSQGRTMLELAFMRVPTILIA